MPGKGAAEICGAFHLRQSEIKFPFSLVSRAPAWLPAPPESHVHVGGQPLLVVPACAACSRTVVVRDKKAKAKEWLPVDVECSSISAY